VALNLAPDMVHYGATKAAQLALARGIAEGHPGTGVTVNSVLPGPTLTERFAGKIATDIPEADSPAEAEAEWIARHRPTSLLGRPASTEEVASAFVYLASDQAAAINGSSIRVDGGVVRSII
jgi:NAD(P)-dependent dehydrogenase (short-subunit alcohol dehydrogenase family)